MPPNVTPLLSPITVYTLLLLLLLPFAITIINLGTCVNLPTIVPSGGADSINTRNRPNNRHHHHLRGDDLVLAVDVEGVLRSVVGGEGGGKERVAVSYKVEGSDPVVEAGIDAVCAVLFTDCNGGVKNSKK